MQGNKAINTILFGTIGIALLVGLFVVSRYNYLLFHSVAELFTVAISLSVFMFAWNTRRFLYNDYLLFIGISYVFLNFLIVLHILSYRGMGVFHENTTNLPTQLWVAIRYTESLTLLAAPFFLRHRLQITSCFLGYSLLCLLLVAAIFHWAIFPDCFIEGQGLTPFKKMSEYLVAVILLAALLRLWLNRDHFADTVFGLLALAIVLAIMVGLPFTLYVDAYGLSNLVGHYLNILFFYFIYRAIIITGLTEPYELLFRDLKRHEAALATARDELELRVEQRTAELQNVNHLLQAEITAKELAQRELQKSEARLRAIFQAAENVSFVLVDFTEPPRIVEFSPGAERLFGYQRAEILGKPFADLHSSVAQATLTRIMDQVKGGEKGFEGELSLLRRSGDIFPALVSMTPVRNSFNGPVVLGVAIDITKRKEAEIALRNSIEEIQDLYNKAPCGYHTLDASGVYSRINDTELQWLGYQRRELLGVKKFYDLLTPHSREFFSRHAPLFRDRGKINDLEFEMIRKDGSILPVLLNATAITGPQGELLMSHSTIFDITESKRAQEALVESEERYRALFEGAPDAIFLIDPHSGVILDVNSAACRLMLMRRPALVGLHQSLLIQPHSADEVEVELARLFHEALRQPGSPPTQHVVHRSDDSEVPVEILAQLVTIQCQPVIQGVFRDISAAKKLENQLRQAQKMEAIGTLAGGIAHDFNNILTPILGYAELVLESLPAESEERQNQQQIIKAARRAKDLVHQILVFGRQAIRQNLPIQPHLIVKEVLILLRSSIPTSIEIEQDIKSDQAEVLADPTQIHQVVMNLCTNAYQAMRDRGGVLRVALEIVTLDSHAAAAFALAPGRYLQLSVSDSGHGMSPVTMERIFEPYFTTKAQEGGTGLGLSVVHGIIKSLNGHISVHSELGVGTTFQVYLPLIAAALPPQAASGAESIAGGSERIMVVDDEAVIVKLHQQMLESLGYRVTAVTSSTLALTLFIKNPDQFDLVITDMAMPKITGADLARKLIEIRPDIPLILCTGFSEIIDEERAKALGIRRFVMKPIIKREIAAVIREILDAKGGGVPAAGCACLE